MKAITDLMKELSIPINRDNYLGMMFNGDVPDPVPAEIEAELPEKLQNHFQYTNDPLSYLVEPKTDFITEVPTVAEYEEKKPVLQEFTTKTGGELVPVGSYNLTGKKKPPYGDSALLSPNAAEAFIQMNRIYKKETGKELIIESAFRDEEHNTRVKGSKTSNHMEGLSIDVKDPHCRAWIKQYGEAYGWYFGTYEGNKNHFNYGSQ